MKQSYARNLGELDRMVQDNGRFFLENNIDTSLQRKVELTLEELFVNMVRYHPETTHPVEICWYSVGRGVRIEMIDRDVDRFDPTEGPAVDPTAPLADRKVGGLGLFLVMKMADSIQYEYHERTSTISFTNQVGGKGVRD